MNWWEKAIAEPWVFISFVLAFGIYRFVKIAWSRLFDEDGLVPSFMKDIQSDSAEMKASLVRVAENSTASIASLQGEVRKGMVENRDAIFSLEHQLVQAIQAKPEDDELFKVLFEDNPIPICFIGDDRTFIRVNNSCAEFFGYSSGELSNMTFMELTEDDDIPADIENVERVKAGALTRYRMEKRYKSKSQGERSAVLYVFRYPERGAFLHYISIIVPI